MRNECSTKHENKANYNRDFIVPDLNFFFLAMVVKRSKHGLKKEIFIFIKNIVLTKNWFAVGNFYEFPEDHMEK